LNNSNHISNSPPYSPLPPPPPLYSPPPLISSLNPLNYINEKNKIKRNENSNERSDLAVVRFEYIIIILHNNFSYLINYKLMEKLNYSFFFFFY